MFPTADTIAALSTPSGTSALAVVRASGPGCAGIYVDLFGHAPRPRIAKHFDYHSVTGALLDDVVVVYFAGPHSYSGEDTLEISTHGNPFIAQRVLEDLFARGCRPAEPGEFTRRAFLNGRVDLSQAEAVMDLIYARSERALIAAQQQLRGSLGRHLNQLIEEVLATLALVEAYIDFPDEDLPPEDKTRVVEAIRRIRKGTDRLLATQHYGVLLREGIKTVIIGEPNAGKSSLLNRLVGSDRALVSPEPGTTRDYIEERINLGTHSIRLIDTAGLNVSPAALERLGIEKTLERAAEADLFLLVLDVTRPIPPLPTALVERLTPENTIVVINKNDLLAGGQTAAAAAAAALPYPTRILFSAQTGFGLEALSTAISEKADAFRLEQGDEIIAINARHAAALTRARECLRLAEQKLIENGPVELMASDLRDTLDAFGEISGRVDNERMLDHLFATFCIGK